MNRAEIVLRIANERVRHFDLPGRELDSNNTVNDWIAIIGRYIFEEARRGVLRPSREDFEDSLVKAAAVILAALEHCPTMEKNECFKGSE